MSAQLRRFAVWLGCLYAVSGLAGEIIILDPSAQKSQAERSKDKARQQAGRTKGDTTVIVVDDGGKKTGADAAEESMREARDYVRPAPPGDPAVEGTTTVILRAAPQSDAEKARLRARSYTVPSAASGSKDCRNVTVTQVGTIGDSPSGSGTVVVEKGNSTVNVQCK